MTSRTLLLMTILGVSGLPAQKVAIPRDPPIYFYNSRLDLLGQNVSKAAGDIANGQLFDTQLANLDAESRLAVERIFTSGRRSALSKLEAARTWARLYVRFEAARHNTLQAQAPEDEWKAKLAALKQSADAARARNKTAGKTLANVNDLLEEVGKSEYVLQFADFLETRDPRAVTAADLRVVGKVQEAIEHLGTCLDGLSSFARPLRALPSSR
jgi:hypothetical protein